MSRDRRGPLQDSARAVSPDTSDLLRVHRSWPGDGHVLVPVRREEGIDPPPPPYGCHDDDESGAR